MSMLIFETIEKNTEELNYDTMLTTLDILFKKDMVDIISPTIKKIVDNGILQTQNDNVIKKLADILDNETQEQIENEYFGLFSPDTQKFIIDNLPNGAKGKLILTIDDTLRSNEFSIKKFILRISGFNYDNDIIDHDNNQYKNIEGIKSICEELSKYHYLGLGIEGGVLESIEVDRPKYSNVSKIDEETGEKKTTKLKNREIITYPLPRKIKKEEIKVKRNRKMKKQ